MLLYGRLSDDLYPGLTAEITLSGKGAEHVTAGMLPHAQLPD